MDPALLKKLESLIASRSTFRHVTHVNPDADGFGSALAMSRHLRRLGKDSQVLLPSPLSRRLAFLPRDGEVTIVKDGAALPSDAVFLLYDFSTLTRLGGLEAEVRRSTHPKVVFDHHDGAIEFEALAFVDTSAGATAQMICDLLEALRVPIDLDLAEPLYVGLVSDTGSFNYGKTTPHSHVVAARLLEAGVDPLRIHGLLEGSNSLSALKVAARVMLTLAIDPAEPRLAHATLPHDQWLEGREDALDVVDLVNQTIGLDGVQAGVLFIQVAPDTTRLSLRSKGSMSIVDVAKSFGGGGHVNAAGATIPGPPDANRDRVLSALREAVAAQLGP